VEPRVSAIFPSNVPVFRCPLPSTGSLGSVPPLAHYIDIDWLREVYRRTRKDGATGIDRQTAEEYARNLKKIFARYLNVPNPAATWSHRFGECISRRLGMARKRGPSAYPPSRTRCFNGRWLWCWKRLMSRVFTCHFPNYLARYCVTFGNGDRVAQWPLSLHLALGLPPGCIRQIARKTLRQIIQEVTFYESPPCPLFIQHNVLYAV